VAISQSDLVAVNAATGAVLVDGAGNQLFVNSQSGAGSDYAFVEIRNQHPSLTWSAGKVWIAADLAGAALSMAVADSSTVRVIAYVYSPLPAVPGTLFTPADFASGLVLPTLPAGTKCIVCIKRDTTGASVVYPENNRLAIQGTSPI
jgi:hypothetical protein